MRLIESRRPVLAKVYWGLVTDLKRNEITVTKHKGTLAWIAGLPGGELIPGTDQDVPDADIDGQGRYMPPKKPARG
jgi:hypothetical protein